MADVTLTAEDVGKYVTLTVHVPRSIRWRVWLATKLIRLAAWVARFGFRVTHDMETDSD